VPVGGLILVAMLAYWLMGRSQRRWWLLVSAAVSIVVLAFLLAEPFTQAYKPLGSSPLELRIAELAARTGVPRSAIVIEHCENATQARMTASWASEKSRVPEWGPFFQLFRASHPSDAERIRLANTYHPWLEGKPLVYSKDFVAPLQIK